MARNALRRLFSRRLPGSAAHAFDTQAIARELLGVDARAVRWSMLIGALLVVVAGLPLSIVLNVWVDEAFTLHTTGSGPAFAWAQAISFEGQPPLYFVLESIWRLLGEDSVAYARCTSILCAAGAVAVSVAAAHRVAPRIPPFVVAIVTAVNPIVIWAAVELRVYSLVLLIGAVLTWAFVAGYASRPTLGFARTAYVVAAAAGLYTQYYIGFVLAAQFIALVLLRRSALRAMTVSLAVVTLIFAPFVPVVLRQFAASDAFVVHSTFVRALYEVVDAAFVFIVPHEQGPNGMFKTGFVAATALLALVIALGRPVLPVGPARVVALAWLLSLLVFGLAFAGTGVPLQSLRHLIVLAPSSMIAALLCLASLTRSRVRAAGVAAGVFTVCSGMELWAHYAPPPAKIGDWHRVAATIAAGDTTTPVAVFPAELALPLGYSYRGRAIAIPRTMPFTISYVRATRLTGEADVARVLDPVRAREPRLWLITEGACEPAPESGYDYGCGVLENYLRGRYRIERSVAFRGSLARLLVRVADVSAVDPSRI